MCTDLQKVWECIAQSIENNMIKEKGTLLKGIGYFTVAKWMINENKVHPNTIRKPVFVIEEKLVKDFNLKRSRPYNSGIIQERCLNFLLIAHNCELNVNMVIDYYKEVVSSFKKLLSEEKNCELPFPKLGKIKIKNKMVTMNFYQEFLERQNKNFKKQIVANRKKNQAISYDPDWNAHQFENRKRPCSAMSTIITRPASSLSQYRPGTGYVGVLPNLRPNSSLSVRSNTSDEQIIPGRPRSRLSLQSHKEPMSRPLSRTSVQSCDEIYQTKPMSRISKQDKPSSRRSVRSVKSNCSMLSKHETFSPSVCPTKLVAECKDYGLPESPTCGLIDPAAVPPGSNLSTSKLEEKNQCVDEKTLFIYGHDRGSSISDETLCHACNIREYRLRQIDNIYKPKVSRDNFMKGDNLINELLNTETLNKRKDQLKQISDYNYNTAKELSNSIENEKNINRKEKKVDSYILKKRPASINIEKKNNFKQSLLDQIQCNKIKKETDKIESLKNEKLMQKELLNSLYDERIRNIEAKNRSKKNYLTIIDEHLKKKNQYTEELKKKDITIPPNKTFVFGPDQAKLQKLNNCKHRQIANYQLEQKNARNIELREQKEKNIDFERNLLNKLKEKDETFQRNLLQKKLNQKKFLKEDLKKLLDLSDTERNKNKVPGSYVSLVIMKSYH
ncbi:hypothetical protein AGLY_006639 [Aphis glycines]|uniref:CCDC81 HU domain-containing protein n=1 Tax=Aphis glycines TaxID=307491 RepID=A0A6G0TS46_APHGL|nr:hypothetical protein AGLY_006639 [Aphis glycines]